ncbi:MAG: glycerol-3-phosphate acyltransferase [Pseudomonadota bacterium]
MTFVLFCLAGYLTGSVNTALVLFRITGKQDPRERFSRNAGTTNVYRVMGPAWAGAVLLVDLGKAGLVSLAAGHWLPLNLVFWVGLFTLTGNRFPCFHRFRGGKGVAHFIGFCLVVSPMVTGFSLLGWCLAFWMSRQPFVGSLALTGILGLGLGFAPGMGLTGFTAIMACVVFIGLNHRRNILEWKTGITHPPPRTPDKNKAGLP